MSEGLKFETSSRQQFFVRDDEARAKKRVVEGVEGQIAANVDCFKLLLSL